MAILTKPQVEKQKRKYEKFIKNLEVLKRIGEQLVNMSSVDKYYKIALILENQGVKHAMHHPDNLGKSYNELLKEKCLDAYFQAII